MTSELKNCFILQSVYLEVCIENEPVKKHRFVEAWSVDGNGECTPNQGLDSFLISSNSYDTAGSMAILAKAWHIPKLGRTYYVVRRFGFDQRSRQSSRVSVHEKVSGRNEENSSCYR